MAGFDATEFTAGARALGKTPAFAVTVVLTLGHWESAPTARYSPAIDAVLLRPLPFPHAERLVKLGQVRPKVPQPLWRPCGWRIGIA